MSKININMCAASDTIDCWEKINFDTAEKCVKKLQKRIALAYTNCNDKQVECLQKKLIHSFYAKAIAINIVTSNNGNRTAGIDGVLWNEPEEKFQAIETLKRRGYKHKPLKRMFIKKSNGQLRPLGIPTIKDRAMQTLYKLALEPIAEITADSCSFGFRHNKSAKDAIAKCIELLSKHSEIKWILKADIKACFDNISHKWIMDNIPIDKEILKQFLQCGYVYNKIFYSSEKGIPQGSCISGIICNMVLDGLERVLKDRFNDTVHIIRYADDFIITGISKASLQIVVPVVECFLSERGLSLSYEKTKITHLKDGFSFLGYRIYKQNNNIISVPTRDNMNFLLNKIKEILNDFPNMSYECLCESLAKKLRGWLNYYTNLAMIESIHSVEFEIVSYITEHTGNKQIAKFIGKIFAQYD